MKTTISRELMAKASVFLLATMAIFAVLKQEYSAPLLLGTLRGETDYLVSSSVYVPPSLDLDSQRSLTINLGGGDCEWELPEYDVPEEIEFHKTLIAGYPSGDKRMLFVQMEALTGWAAKDEWDFQYLGTSNHPFIKANFPHHEGIWGWGNVADQMVLMIRSVRSSLVEYHDILWDIDYAATWEIATENMNELYFERPPLEDFLVWRDDRVMDECHWYGWEIDFWMEGGLLRDMFSHGMTTREHFALIMDPVNNHRHDLEVFYAEKVAPGVANGTITASYHHNCDAGFVTDGCAAVAVLSAEKLRDYTEGPAETAAIANVLLKDYRTGQFVIAPEAWDCVWRELIVNNKGLKTVDDRPGFNEMDYNFSEEMLELMIHELTRLIDKYGSAEWTQEGGTAMQLYGPNTKTTAARVVELLVPHRASIQAELSDVQTGVRELTDKDFLGPKERQRRLQLKEQSEGGVVQEKKDHAGYFYALDKRIKTERRKKMKQQALGKKVEEEKKEARIKMEREKMRQQALGKNVEEKKKEAGTTD